MESFVLDILGENRAPVIQQQTPGQISAGAMFIHDLLARDADLDPLAYELTQAPDGATIDEFGRIHWQTQVADIGSHNFAVRVTDPRGGEATDAFTLVVAEDTIAPKVSLIATPNDADRNILPWMGPFRVYTRAIDDVAVASVTLSANGQEIPLDAAGTATFTFEDWTFQAIEATATATDTNGNVTTKTITFDYDFPEGWSGAGAEDIPEALISSPTESETVFGMVAVTGTAAHAEFDSYKLSYRHAEETQFTEIVTSRQAVNDGELGVWDTTMLENDEYLLRLEVATTGGVVNVVERHVGLSGALKLGNFRLSFTDLTIPVSGIPIQVTRTYDTLRADRDGDLGYGWRLEFRDADLRVGLPKSGLEDIGIYTPMRPGVKVYMTLPGQERMGWTFTPRIRVLPGLGDNLVLASPRFTPDPGNTAQLQVGGGQLFVNKRGELFAAGNIPWNPAAPDFGGGYTVVTRDGLRYRIDGDTGKMNTVTDRNGNTLTFTDAGIESDSGIGIVISRDGRGRITSITDPLGNSVRYSYSPAGDLVSVTDREGNITSFVYSAAKAHFLQQVIDPLGRTGVRTEYNEDGRLTRTIDGSGSAVTITYDPENLLVVKQDPLGNPTTYELDPRGNTVRTTDAYGGITSRTYNELDLPLTETDPLGRTTKHVYDARGNELSRIDPRGYVTTWTYDRFSVATSQVDALGNAFQATVDPAGNPVSVTTPLGDRLSVAYTSGGVPTGATMEGVGSTAFTLIDDLPTTVNTSAGAVLNFTYDENGLPLTVSSIKTGSTGTVTPKLTVSYSANGLVTSIADSEKLLRSYEYDAVGNMVLETDSLGNATGYEYDDANRLTRTLFADGTTIERRYDAAGNLIAIIDQAGRETSYEYDALGRRIASLFPDTTPQDATDNPRRSAQYDAAGQITRTIDELGRVTQFAYDLAGNVVTQTDALGNVTRFEYDAVGNVTTEVDPLGHATSHRHDQLSRRTETLWPDGTSEHLTLNGRGQVTSRTNGAGETIHYEYDDGGRLTAVIDSLGHRTSYQYNELGELVSVTDALNRTTQYQYDTFGNLVAKQLVTGERETFTYDSAGNLISTTDFNGATTSYEYDSLQRLVKVVRPDDTVAITYSPTGRPTSIQNHLGITAFAYDERDRLVQLTQFDSRTINYRYDDAGNITEVVTPSGTTEYVYDSLNRVTTLNDVQNGVTAFTYDAAGNLVRREYPNGTYQAWLYTGVGRVSQIEVGTMTTVLERLTYEFDTAGRRTSVMDVDGRRTSYRYDAGGRLVVETIDAPNATRRIITYGYDAVGNRIDRVDSTSGATTYEYDQRDRLLRESSNEGVATYQYDANGNRIERDDGSGQVTTYEWTSDNRMRRVVQISGGVTNELVYAYDGQGHQVIRVEDGAETRFLVDPNRPYSEILETYDVNGAATAAFVFPPGDASPIAQQSNGVTTFLYGDHLGSTFLATDATAAVTDEVRYEAFGTVSQRIGTTSITHMFGGEVRDPTTQLNYLRARVLDTHTGTFLSSDPFPGNLNDPGSLHRYLYVNQDPINHRDPSGESKLAETLLVSSIVGTLSGTGLGLFYAATGGSFGTGFKRGFAIGFFSASGSILLGRVLGGTADVAFRVGTGSAARFASMAQLSAEGQALMGGIMATLVADVGLAGFQLFHYFDSGTAEQVMDNARPDRLISGDKPSDVFELGKTLRKRSTPK
ncbi:MAG: hypothetical protein KatS3mg111_1816 [Pirellulaceae bacterium]|nr:MAG: hypothetical protein KatS3mg111_1816 [Pirellulaceae bacterium]